jgi:hypothetical protein
MAQWHSVTMQVVAPVRRRQVPLPTVGVGLRNPLFPKGLRAHPPMGTCPSPALPLVARSPALRASA